LEEARAIRAAIKGHPWEHAFVLMLTGLRRSEVMGLCWTDVDLENGQVCVTKSRTVSKGESADSTVVGRPKTSNGERIISLADDEIAILTAARLRMGMVDGPLVADAWGRPAYPDALGDAWRDMCKAQGIRYLDTRALRRTSVTLMRDAGVPDHIVARHHGHDEVIMRRAYTRPDSLQLAAAAAIMQRLRSTG
jgi:integrase